MSDVPPKSVHGARVFRSGLWMLVNSGVVRGLSFLAQLGLAAVLSAHDFGVYAAAMAVSAFLTSFRDGGMGQWLIQGGVEAFEGRSGDAFWAGSTFNLLLGLILAGLAAPAATLFGEGEIAEVVLVAALSFPLVSLGSFYRTSLAINLRMRQVAMIEMSSAIVKYLLIVLLALAGFGALSFVLPLPLTYLIEAALGYAATRDRAWERRSSPRHWFVLLAGNRWILLGTFVATVALQVDFVIVGALAPISVLGTYYFAYQLTYMSASLITENARRVLFPGFVATASSARASATLKASAVATTLGSPILLLPAAIIGPLEQLLWSGKWEQAVLPLVVLSLGLPVHLLTAITQASLLSRGEFRLWSGVNAIRATAVALSATAGASISPNSALGISAAISGGLLVANVVQIVWAYRGSEVQVSSVIAACGMQVLTTPLALLVMLATVDNLTLSPILQLLVQFLVFVMLWLVGQLLIGRRQLSASIAFVRRAIG